MRETKHENFENQALRAFRARSDTLLLWVLSIHLLVCLGVGLGNGSWGVALLLGVPALLVPAALRQMDAGGLATRLAVAGAFMVFAALLIHQAHGMIEAHFGIFVLLAFLVLYCDWKAPVFAAVIIAVHHILFSWMQAGGTGIYVFPQTGTIELVTLHATYVVVETIVLCFVALRLRAMVLDAAEVSRFAEKVGEGHLNHNFNPVRLERSSVVRAVANMQGQLRESLTLVHQSTNRLSTLVSRLNASAQKIASDADDQRHATSSIASAVQEMTASVATITDEATSARQLSEASLAAAASGGLVVSEAVTKMSGIAQVISQAAERVEDLGQKSERTAQIVNIIKEIADQTNLLALNAAIEAARAGEMGRGFAVVADEVRKLAERTTQATNEINQMMGEMRGAKQGVLDAMQIAVSQVEVGVLRTSSAGEHMAEITTQARSVGEVVEAISGALNEQTKVAGEIANHVDHVATRADSASESTHDIAEEAAEIEDVANSLRSSLARFTL
jgi:methyl-accepting chemotaxis protein